MIVRFSLSLLHTTAPHRKGVERCKQASNFEEVLLPILSLGKNTKWKNIIYSF